MADASLPFQVQEDRPLRSLYLDLNSYFASVEQADRPELRGKPVAVCPVMADTSFVIAASYEAKAFGVKTGTQIGEAKDMCPGLILIDARHDLYVHMHDEIIDLLEGVLPIEKVCSIDEMRFRLIGNETHKEDAIKIAKRMKQVLWESIAPSMNCSIGIGPNAFIAKLGTELQKPDGLVVLEASDLPDAFRGKDLTFFTGINKKLAIRLKANGIFSSDDLIEADAKRLRTGFGSIIGERWWHLLRGYELPDERNEGKSLGHSHVLPPSLRNDKGCRDILLRLTHKAAARMRRRGMVSGFINLHVTGFEKSWKTGFRIEPTNDTVEITEQILEHWKKRDFEKPKGVGVTFGALSKPDEVTPSLFDEKPTRTHLNEAIDHMNDKFGKNSIFVAGLEGVKDAAKEKIAFQKTELFSEGKGDNKFKKKED
jgi:DNA polymerase-4